MKILMKDKKGVSTVVASMIMILLVIAMAAILWTVIKGFTSEEQLDAGKQCLDILIKNSVTLNEDNTCYNLIGPGQGELLFSVSIGNVEVDELIVLVTTPAETKSYSLKKTSYEKNDLLTYSRETGIVTIPQKNAGKTYIATEITEKPSSIEIAPKIKENQCDISDSITLIFYC